jgi:hypothetical protein
MAHLSWWIGRKPWIPASVGYTAETPAKREIPESESKRVLGQSRKPAEMLRAGLYARVSTLSMQSRAMREYAGQRGWTIAVNVREVGTGAAKREAREELLEAARRREIDVALVWGLDRWDRSVTDLLATLQELEYLGMGCVSLTEALDLTTPAGRAMAGLLAASSPLSKGSFPYSWWYRFRLVFYPICPTPRTEEDCAG